MVCVLFVVNVGKSVVENNDSVGNDNVGDNDGDDVVVVDDDMILVFELVLVLLVEVSFV